MPLRQVFTTDLKYLKGFHVAVGLDLPYTAPEGTRIRSNNYPLKGGRFSQYIKPLITKREYTATDDNVSLTPLSSG